MKNGPAPYDKHAISYDRMWRRYIARTLGFLKASISFRSSDKILDIACGTGEFECLILRKHPDQQMIGIDISEKHAELRPGEMPRVSKYRFFESGRLGLAFSRSDLRSGDIGQLAPLLR
jgi:ubiquinone/menaquinone biosynthesis C-methylase UbiE